MNTAKMQILRIVLTLGIMGIGAGSGLEEAWSHPLGNFSLNHYTVIEIHPQIVIAQHVLDFAEIPSYNELAKVDVDNDNLVTPQEIENYRAGVSKRFLPSFHYALIGENGASEALTPSVQDKKIILSYGQAGLTCLQIRLICTIKGDFSGQRRFAFQDGVTPFVRGSQEIRIKTLPGVTLREQDIESSSLAVPILLADDIYEIDGLDVRLIFQAQKPEGEVALPVPIDVLTMMNPMSIPQYPLEPDANGAYKILKSPIQPNMEVQAKISTLQPRSIMDATGLLGLPSGSSASTAKTAADSSKQDSGWADLIRKENLNPAFVLMAILASIFFGAAHALSPGHGKTVVAAYLVGSRGTIWHAVFLGIVVTITHVSSVLALGLITLFFSQYIMPETLYPVIESGSGLLIIAIGMSLFLKRYGAYQRMRFAESLGAETLHHHGDEHPHPHPHEHPHGHEHNHDHAQVYHHSLEDHEHRPGTHTHEIPADAAMKDLLLLGITGGILPCPTAIVVLLVAISMHRLLFGLLLIVFFSFGLAAVLIAIGVLMVTAKRLMDRFSGTGKTISILQIVSPALVMLLGLLIFVRGLQTGGYITFHF
ncbi:MAG: sulfite exporter TauE/SafE family protein [Candidatus Omnitrophota bacterium]